MRIIKDTKTTALLAVILLAAAQAGAGCASGESGRVEIVPENDCWSPVMSSAVGIGLLAQYTGAEEATYEWSADYGGFLLWTPEVIRCRPPCITDETVWWTYITEEDHSSTDLPEEVHITVRATEKRSGEILAESGIVLYKAEGGSYCIEPGG